MTKPKIATNEMPTPAPSADAPANGLFPLTPAEAPAVRPGAGRRMDPEIQAMARLERILSELDVTAASRVVGWLASRYAVYSLAEGLPRADR